MEDKQLGQMYVTALRAKYVAEMEEAKATLMLYTTKLVAIGEHSDLMEEHDKWIEKYTNSKDKLESLDSLFGNQSING
jgi:ABC-type transporter Mla maintaining outer membrane lipid asymmetry ATPase subunit MlaF